MKLYERDYLKLTEEEEQQEKTITDEHTTYLGTHKIYNSKMYRKFPKAIRHFQSLFPNNFLDIVDLKDSGTLKSLNQGYLSVIEDNKSIESDIQRFIKEQKAYHIVGAMLKGYHFGHHSAYLFPEFQLGNSYQVDYLLVGNASGGHQFILVEFENPYGKIIIRDGEFGDVIRKGINQVNDWKMWIEANYTSFVESFQKETFKELSKEFYKLDTSRIHYIVVAGRRKNFTEKTYNLKRRLMKEQNISLLHYDNLYDLSERIIGEDTY